MADEPQSNPQVTLRAINWREAFPFTNIFRAFRVAVHPSKLVLGLLALLTLYAGGRILDGIWPNGHLANPGEVAGYQQFSTSNPRGDFGQDAEATRKSNQAAYSQKLQDYKVLPDKMSSDEAAQSFSRLGDLKGKIMFEANEVRPNAARAARDAALKAADQIQNADQKAQARRAAEDRYQGDLREIDGFVAGEMSRLKQVVPHGIFEEFFEYQVGQVNGVAAGVVSNTWVGRGNAGVFTSIYNFFAVGPVWLWKYHTVYAVLFTLLFLLTWAVFGGAISRIAAVQVARDEKISVRQALRFSLNKVLSFVFAPVIPLLIVLVLGLLIAVGGLLLYVPWVGPIVVGGLFFLALIAGVVITLVLFGTVGGLNLMYPTIAVEGSDSFDAISRSFSYVFARPWRMLFYTLVAIVYGALTYLFVRFFVWVVLLVTHFFAHLFLNHGPEGNGYYFARMWPEPLPFWSFRLPFDVNYAGLKWSEDFGAFLLSFWVYLLIGLVGAYAISYYLSVSTIIYGLMRREVDATELEDVYVEEAEDDLADVAPPAAATAGTPATTAPLAAAAGTGAPGSGTTTTPTAPAAPSGTPDWSGSSSSPATIVGTVPPARDLPGAGTPADVITPVVPPPGDTPPPSANNP